MDLPPSSPVRRHSDSRARVFAASLSPTEDALLAGALVRAAEADEEPSLLVLLLLLHAGVRLPFGRLPPRL